MKRKAKKSGARGEAIWFKGSSVSSNHFVTNQLCGLPEVLCDKRRVYPRILGKLTDLAFPTAYEDGPATSAKTGQHVWDSVPNHVALVE
jgi:hypothetical protein